MSAIVVAPPHAPPVPLIVTVPHAGRALTPALTARLRVPAVQLRQLEDPWVDRLFEAVPAHGGWLVTTRWARAVADVNRAADEFAFAAPVPGWRATAKARIGLGVVPTRLAGAPIYTTPLDPAAVDARVAQAHRPYHAALGALVDDLHARFGEVLVVDGHSMPDNAQPPALPPADAVIGDRWSTSAEAGWVAELQGALEGARFTTARNRPYAGGYITRHYGRPGEGVHVVQLELRRGLYMDEVAFAPTSAFAAIRVRLDGVVAALVRRLRGRGHAAFALAGE